MQYTPLGYVVGLGYGLDCERELPGITGSCKFVSKTAIEAMSVVRNGGRPMPVSQPEQPDSTAVATPSNAQLQSQSETSMPRGVRSNLPVFIKHAANAEMWDVEGRRYIDFHRE